MDIGFSEEQELLRDTARKFLDGNCKTKFVRRHDGDRDRRHARILAPARRERLARHHLSRRGRRQRARPDSIWSC